MLDRKELEKLVRASLETGDQELGCDECLDQVDSFVELELAGLDAAAAMPLVKNHLKKCGECQEEFEALLRALRTIEKDQNGTSIFGPLGRLWRRRREGL